MELRVKFLNETTKHVKGTDVLTYPCNKCIVYVLE